MRIYYFFCGVFWVSIDASNEILFYALFIINDLELTIWISSFDSIQLGKDDHLLSGITGFEFLQISVQSLHSQFLVNISRGICGHQMFCAQDNIAKLPGCV